MEQRRTESLNSPHYVQLFYFYFNFSNGCVTLNFEGGPQSDGVWAESAEENVSA
jgi:hypothetical protein